MQYILLTGHRKSGTSLLHKLFDGHPQLNVYPVDLSFLYAFFPRWTSNSSFNQNDRIERFKLVLEKSTSEFQGFQISPKINSFDVERFWDIIFSIKNPSTLEHPFEIIDLVSHAYCEYAELDAELPFVFKETSQVVNLREMLKHHTDIKCLQIVRDPRDNYAAIKKGVSSYYVRMNEGYKESLASLVNRVYVDLKTAADLISRNDKNFFSIHFENLVTNPKHSSLSFCKSLNIEWSPCFLEPTFLSTPYLGNSFSSPEIKGISSKNVGSWRSEITLTEARIIEFYLGDLMKIWGYDVDSTIDEQLEAVSSFYHWHNERYFFNDSFSIK